MSDKRSPRPRRRRPARTAARPHQPLTIKRGADAIEEQLRDAIRQLTRDQYGACSALAQYLDVPVNFISEYKSGARKSAGLTRSLKMMRWAGISISDLSETLQFPHDQHLVHALRDPDIAAVVNALCDLKDQRPLRTTLVQAALSLQAQFGTPQPQQSVPDGAGADRPRAAAHGRPR